MNEPIKETEINVEDLNQNQETTEIPLDSLSNRKIGEGFEKPNLDGKTVTIFDVKLEATNRISKTQDGSREYRPLILRLFYNDNTLFETYGGIMQFRNADGTFREPTIWVEGQNEAAKLFRKWSNFVGKNPKETSLKEFLLNLKGKKAIIENKKVMYMGKEFNKNVIKEFIKE
ncbi:MAG: hypothetical protein D6734_07625 [Candidatus Schekmanbacteria bacterium]|nr:MAG: hypothetical protein D6734_07625 [Candidatus Schekmanbacteria bacterium]